jgi:MFS family permease
VLRRHERFGRIARLYLLFIILFYLSLAVSATLMNLYLEALGLSRGFIGVFHAASQFGGLLLALPAIFAFDRLGRRASLVVGAALSAGVRTFTVISSTPEVIFVAEALSGFGTVMFGLASVSLLADASSNDNRASLYAFADFTRTAALLVGSILAGLLPGWVALTVGLPEGDARSYQIVLIASYLVRLAGVLPLAAIALASPAPAGDAAAAVAPAGASADPADAPQALPEVSALRYLRPRVLLQQRPQVYAFAVPYALLILAEALVFTFFNLLLRDRYGASDAVIGLVIGLNALIGSAFSLLAPAAAARFGYVPVIVAGSLLSAAGMAVFAWSAGLWAGVLAVFVQVAASQASRVLYRTYVINASPRQDYFIVSTMIALASNIGPAIGPPISGEVQETLGYTPLFAAAIALTVGAALLFWLAAAWSERAARRRPYGTP